MADNTERIVVKIDADTRPFNWVAEQAIKRVEARKARIALAFDARKANAYIRRQTAAFYKFQENDFAKASQRLARQKDRALKEECDARFRQARTCEERMTKLHVEALAENARRTERANKEAVRRQEKHFLTLGKVLRLGGLIDLGAKGVRPMYLLMTAALALAPAFVALGASAGVASTSVVALGAAALGTVSGVSALTFASTGVAQALKLQERAAEGSADAQKELTARLAQMSPAARRLFGQIVAIKNEMANFATVVESAVLPGFSAFLDKVRSRGGGASAVDIFKRSIVDVGALMSDAASRAGDFAASAMFRGNLSTIVDNNTAAFARLADAALAVLEPITRLIARASHLLVRFAGWIDSLANRFNSWIDTFSDNQLADYFRRAGDEAAKWGSIVTSFARILYGLFAAAIPAGVQLSAGLEDSMRSMADWVNSAEGQKELAEVFQSYADMPWHLIADGIRSVGDALEYINPAANAAHAGLASLWGFTGLWPLLDKASKMGTSRTLNRFTPERAGATYTSQVPALANRGRSVAEEAAYEAALGRARNIADAEQAWRTALAERGTASTRAAQALQTLREAQRDAAISARDHSRAVADSIQRIRDARLAYRDAVHGVGEAEQDLARAHRDVADAQKELSEARRQATKDLIELRREVQGLSVDEQEARLKLDIAKETRKALEYTTGVDPLRRRMIDLDVASAQRELNDTLAEGRDKRQALAEAERKGVDGSDVVIQARRDLADAIDGVSDAEWDLQKAHENVARAARDVRDAQDDATRAAQDAAIAAQEQAVKIDGARQAYNGLAAAAKAAGDNAANAKTSYDNLKKAVTDVPAATATKVSVYGSVVLTSEYLKKRKALTVSTYESQVPAQARAAGGPLRGPGTKTSDSFLIRASDGEFMQPAHAVDYYGENTMEAIRAHRIPRRALKGYAGGGRITYPELTDPYRLGVTAATMAAIADRYATTAINAIASRKLPVPTVPAEYAVPTAAINLAARPGVAVPGTLGPPWPPSPAAQRGDSGVWRSIHKMVQASGIPHDFGNAYRAGDPLWHGSGRAIDYEGYNQDALAGFFLSMKPKVLELIHRSNARDYGVTRGRDNYMGESLLQGHRDHVHIAMATGGLVRTLDSGGLLPPGVSVVANRTGQPETVRNAGQEAALRAPVRIDARDLRMLAFYIAQASARPIEIDGRVVADAVSAYTFNPAGV